MRVLSCMLLACFSLVHIASADEFQFHTEVTVVLREGEQSTRDAFLWLPPAAERVRGLIVAGETLMERLFVTDPQIRAAADSRGLGILYIRSGLATVDLDGLLETLATQSGYEEITRSPLMFVGHSAGGPQARDLAARYADRSFALLQYRGGAPGGTPSLAPGVYCLAMFGQFDEFWGTMRDAEGAESWERAREWIGAYRAGGEGRYVTFLVEPGAGHFGWSKRNATYAAAFLAAAADARIDPEGGGLRPVQPNDGWLTPLDAIQSGQGTPFPAAAFEGDPARTNWHPNKEFAERTLAYHDGIAGRADQFLAWEDDVWVDAGVRFFFTAPAWTDDGQSFRVHPVYRATVPGRHNGHGPIWPEAGKPVDNSGRPIHIQSLSGSLVATGPNTFRLRMDPLGGGSPARATFLAYSPGDVSFRHAELPGMLPRGFRGFTGGDAQIITFPRPEDPVPSGPPVALTATSSAGLPVAFHVASGPARVENGILHLTQIPRRARYPIEIRVVASQMGRGTEPRVQTADPVAWRLWIRNPAP